MTLAIKTAGTAADPIEEAVQELVSSRKQGRLTYVSLPMFFPGGTPVTVRVSKSPHGYLVSDNGFTYRELEAIGAERSFGRAGSAIAATHGVGKDRRTLFIEVDQEELARAIADIAAASWQITAKIYDEHQGDSEESELGAELAEKLISMFGAANVRPRQIIRGTSSLDWEVSAEVAVEGGQVVFQAVGSMAQSVYKANSTFHDIAGIENPPKLIAVVRDISALGQRVGLLSQRALVIEEGQSEEVFRGAAK